MAFKPVKKTTFLEAVAACIQHEKELFDFYARHAESMTEGSVKDLFFQLAEDVDEHLQLIGDIYSQVNEGETLPNLKMASEVHKFHTTSLNILMRRLDRNKNKDAGKNELEAVNLARQEHEDTHQFYQRMAEKFEDPNVKYLFQRLANFQEENRILLESYATYLTQGTSYSQPAAYWEEETG